MLSNWKFVQWSYLFQFLFLFLANALGIYHSRDKFSRIVMAAIAVLMFGGVIYFIYDGFRKPKVSVTVTKDGRLSLEIDRLRPHESIRIPVPSELIPDPKPMLDDFQDKT